MKRSDPKRELIPSVGKNFTPDMNSENHKLKDYTSVQLKARNESNSKEVQHEYQRPAEISDNVTRGIIPTGGTTKQFSRQGD